MHADANLIILRGISIVILKKDGWDLSHLKKYDKEAKNLLLTTGIAAWISRAGGTKILIVETLINKKASV